MLKKFKDTKMSPEKKVISLLFALVILMAACVYTHLPQFMEKQDSSNNNTTTVEKVEEKPIEKVVEEVKTESTQNEQAEEAPKEETQTTEENLNTIDEVKTEEPISEEVNQVVEEIEENLEPLITTDKRYNRTDDEKNIEDLSRTAQELQIKMSSFVKENPIIFKKDSFKVTGKSDETVQKVAEALKEFPNIKIEVAGHTDASGKNEVNAWFSKQRAKGVRARLISLGIDKNRIKARGYGEDIPLEGINKYSKENRRVEFNIVEE